MKNLLFYLCGFAVIALLSFTLASCDEQPGGNFEVDGERSTDVFSVGKRVGWIVKLSRKGYGSRLSFEGQMVLGAGGHYTEGEDGPSIILPSPFRFSVLDADAALIKDLEQSMGAGDRVALYYEQQKYTRKGTDTDYHVKAVLRWGSEGWERLDGQPFIEAAWEVKDKGGVK